MIGYAVQSVIAGQHNDRIALYRSGEQIYLESKFILNFHRNEIINNILNILQLESGMLDSRYNKEWFPG